MSSAVAVALCRRALSFARRVVSLLALSFSVARRVVSLLARSLSRTLALSLSLARRVVSLLALSLSRTLALSFSFARRVVSLLSRSVRRVVSSVSRCFTLRRVWEVGRLRGKVSRGEKMAVRGTDPESYITEFVLAYAD